MSWIKRQQKKFIEQERQSEREYLTRESHYFQGRRYLLNIIEAERSPKVTLRSKRFIDMSIKPGSLKEIKEKVLREWYREQLKKQIPPLLDKWQNKIGVEVSDWGVKQMKTKWGSCNIEAKRIWLNLELAKNPKQCLEYIIVHELMHLIEKHHNEHFKSLMDKHMPQWRSHKVELNRLPVAHADWSY